MLKRKIFTFTAILTTVTLLGIAGCTQADIEALEGIVKNVDSVSGNVTVTLKDGTTRTFNFTDVEVDTIKQALGNASLEVGDEVTVKVRKNGHVEELEVENAEVHGIIKSVGTDNVTITTRKQGDITLKVTSETRIRIEDKGTAAFSDLRVGQEVEVKYDVNTKKALRINVEDEEEDEGEVEGIITATDDATKTVTIKTEKRGEIILKVTSESVIRIEDKRTAAFSDLAAGHKVEAEYNVSTMNAQKLKIDMDEEDREDKNHEDDNHEDKDDDDDNDHEDDD